MTSHTLPFSLHACSWFDSGYTLMGQSTAFLVFSWLGRWRHGVVSVFSACLVHGGHTLMRQWCGDCTFRIPCHSCSLSTYCWLPFCGAEADAYGPVVSRRYRFLCYSTTTRLMSSSCWCRFHRCSSWFWLTCPFCASQVVVQFLDKVVDGPVVVDDRSSEVPQLQFFDLVVEIPAVALVGVTLSVRPFPVHCL